MSTRPVPVPPELAIAFLVMTAEPLDREDLVPLPERSLLRLRGSSIAALDHMSRLPHQRLVSRVVTTESAVAAAEAARQEALSLAAAHNGLVIDLQTPRILDDETERPRHAAEWFRFEYDPDDTSQLRTHGLSVFGLPEIVAHDVPDALRPHYDMVVVGIVQRLIHEWPEHDPVGPVTITVADMMAGYEGAAPDSEPSPGVSMLIDYDPDEPALVVSIVDDPRNLFFN